MTGFDRRRVDLRALNSLTKYPEIPTYHRLDKTNGCLTDGVLAWPSPVIGTEKVDGTNARIVLLPDYDGGYLIGSREELLYANGDLIGDHTLGIVENLRDVADSLALDAGEDRILVLFMELYGGRIGGQSKNYSTKGAVGWRLFDVAVIEDVAEKLTWPRERIAGWRDHGGQPWLDEMGLHAVAAESRIDLTPRLFELDAAELPADVDGMHAFLGKWLPTTLVALDDSGKGAPEGIVLRARDRSVIAKARFQDYERTLRRRGGA